MAEESEQGAPPADGDTGTQDPEPTPERTFTQAEVDAIAKKERSKGKRSAQAELRKASSNMGTTPEQTPTPQAATPDGSGNELAEMRAEITKMREDSAFKDAMLQIPHTLNDQQRGALRTMFDPANPAGVVETATALFGPATSDTPAAAPDATKVTPPTATGVAGAYEPGAPSAPPREQDMNPTAWSKTDYERINERGPGAGLTAVNAWRDNLSGGGGGLFRRKIPR